MLTVELEDSGNEVVLHCKGHIVNGAETASLRTVVFSRTRANKLALDLSRVDVIDAHGLGALLELREWALANGKRFTLVNPTGLIQRVFAITRLDSVFDISSREDALPAEADDEPSASVSIHGVARCRSFGLGRCADIT
jgi:anti-anti-sigma factor